MDKRTILAIVLSLAVLLVYQIFFVKPPTPQKVAAPQHATNQMSREKSAAPADASTATSAVAKPAPKAAVVKPEAPARDIKVETAHYTAIFSTRGAALKSFKLKGYYQDCYECTDDIWPRVKGFLPAKRKRSSLKQKILWNWSMFTPACLIRWP